MNKLLQWYHRRTFQSDLKRVLANHAAQTSSLDLLAFTIDLLRLPTFGDPQQPQLRGHPIETTAHTVDNLIIDTRRIISAIEKHGVFDQVEYLTRSHRTIPYVEYLLSNQGNILSRAAVRDKLLVELRELHAQLGHNISIEHENVGYYLRQTRALVEEGYAVTRLLLADSDQHESYPL